MKYRVGHVALERALSKLGLASRSEAQRLVRWYMAGCIVIAISALFDYAYLSDDFWTLVNLGDLDRVKGYEVTTGALPDNMYSFYFGRRAFGLAFNALGSGPATVAVRGRLVYRASCGMHRIEAEPTGTEDPFLCRPAAPPTLAMMPADATPAGLPDGTSRLPDGGSHLPEGGSHLPDGQLTKTDHLRNGEP